ncbi:biotin transporter BioY [Gordonia phthalatica]|uniref:Biotin transporter n=1 Tax=Gordonia phthalatica TaxID=1136941 RepID=A0A0N9N7M0_9ACTN|nr:biotin transporter BioY [Gordonia phthalatica]ALG86657.1 biotin biosynthesis protein BioY [Gordonia phthalatica]
MVDLAQAAVFAALIAVLGLTPAIGIAGPVPITLQTLGVMLAGAVLGPKKGTLAVAIFMILAIAGLPILSGGRTGWVSLNSPTGGYFIGFLPGVLLIGLLTAWMMPRYNIVLGIIINLVGGAIVIYVFGIALQMIRTDAGLWALITANAPFLWGDTAKAVIAALVAGPVHRGRPGLIAPLLRSKSA